MAGSVVFCGSCGGENVPQARFCTHCQARLEELRPKLARTSFAFRLDEFAARLLGS